MPIEEVLKSQARKTTLDLLRANGVHHEDDLIDISESQLTFMGISVVERRKVLARTDSLRYNNNHLSIDSAHSRLDPFGMFIRSVRFDR